jgi:hypothetical protein
MLPNTCTPSVQNPNQKLSTRPTSPIPHTASPQNHGTSRRLGHKATQRVLASARANADAPTLYRKETLVLGGWKASGAWLKLYTYLAARVEFMR